MKRHVAIPVIQVVVLGLLAVITWSFLHTGHPSSLPARDRSQDTAGGGDGTATSMPGAASAELGPVVRTEDLSEAPAFDSLVPKAGFVVGVVVDEEAFPVDGARVQAVTATATSDKRGRFELDARSFARHFELRVEAAGFTPAVRRGVRAGDEVRVLLVGELTLSGRVMDRAGKPIGGARIRWSVDEETEAGHLLREPRYSMGGEAVSEADGTYRIPGFFSPQGWTQLAADHATFEIEARGFAPSVITDHQPVASVADREAHRDFVLSKGAGLVVIVVDEASSSPIPGACAAFDWIPRDAESTHRCVGVLRSNGSFEINQAPVSFDQVGGPSLVAWLLPRVGTVVASAPGYADGTAPIAPLAEGVTETVTLRLKPTTATSLTLDPDAAQTPREIVGSSNPALRLVVVDHSGTGILGATVMHEEPEPALHCTTDERGEVLLFFAPDGETLLGAAPGKGSTEMRVAQLEQRFAKRTRRAEPSDGPLRLRISAPGYASASVDAGTPRDTDDPVARVVLEDECRLRGRVVASDGVAASRIVIDVWSEKADPAAIAAEYADPLPQRRIASELHLAGDIPLLPDETFEVRGLPSGRCHVFVLSHPLDERTRTVLASVTAIATDSRDLLFDLQHETAGR